MKKTLLVVAVAALATAGFAGPEHIIKQRAKDLRDENNARQGVQPRPITQPSSPQARPVTPTAVSQVASAAQQSLARFQADLSAVKPGGTLDDAQKQKLIRDLTGAAEGNKPSAGTADRFVTSLHKVLSSKTMLPASRAKLVQDIDALLNPAKYPQAKMEAIFEDIRSIAQNNGVSNLIASDIAATARVLSAEVRKS